MCKFALEDIKSDFKNRIEEMVNESKVILAPLGSAEHSNQCPFTWTHFVMKSQNDFKFDTRHFRWLRPIFS